MKNEGQISVTLICTIYYEFFAVTRKEEIYSLLLMLFVFVAKILGFDIHIDDICWQEIISLLANLKSLVKH